MKTLKQIFTEADEKTNAGKKGFEHDPDQMVKMSSSGTKIEKPGDTRVKRAPQAMDVPSSAHKPSVFDPKQVAGAAAQAKDAGAWNPSGIDNEFAKSVLQTKDIKKTLQQMPPDHFSRNFSWVGAQNANQLVTNPAMFNRAMDYLSQNSPIVAQMLGQKSNKNMPIANITPKQSHLPDPALTAKPGSKRGKF